MIYFQLSLPSFLPRLLGDIHCEDALVGPGGKMTKWGTYWDFARFLCYPPISHEPNRLTEAYWVHS